MKIIITYTKTGKNQTHDNVESIRFVNGDLTIVLLDGGFLRLYSDETPFTFQVNG